MLKNVKNFLYLTLPSLLLLFLILELVFRTLIPASERPNAKWNTNFHFLQYENQPEEGLFTIGNLAQQQGQWRINNYGWNSPTDYHPKTPKMRIAVIGDSYVEAFQVDKDKSFHALLRSKLGDQYEVYNFGFSFAPLSHYLHYARYVDSLFQPDILIFNVVHNDFRQSIYQHHPKKDLFFTLQLTDSTLVEHIPQPTTELIQPKWYRRLIKKSALVRYLYLNLRIEQIGLKGLFRKKRSKKRFNSNIRTARVHADSALIKQTTEYILHQIKKENPNKDLLFVMDAPRFDIYNNQLKNSSVIFLNELFAAACQKYQLAHIDLTKLFAKDYQQNQRKFNSDWDGHWNEYGHQMVGDILCNYLITEGK